MNDQHLTYFVVVCVPEVLSPPSNISASVEDGRLLVMWGLPGSRTNESPNCFEYELDLGDKVKNVFLNELLQMLIIDQTTDCFVLCCTYCASRNNKEDLCKTKSAKLSTDCWLMNVFKQERIKSLKEQQSYTELNDPTHTYRVRIRAKITERCPGAPQWSEWSHIVGECCLSQSSRRLSING